MALSRSEGQIEATDARLAAGVPAGSPQEGHQPFWRRSWKIDVAMSPYSCTPPWVRSPVQMMISVRAGRIPARCGENPTALPFQRSENPPCWLRQPDGPRSRLGIAEEEMALPVVRPSQRQDLALAASGQQKKADDGDPFRRPALMRRQRRRQASDLPVRQEALPAPTTISPDAPAGVGVFRPQPPSPRPPS